MFIDQKKLEQFLAEHAMQDPAIYNWLTYVRIADKDNETLMTNALGSLLAHYSQENRRLIKQVIDLTMQLPPKPIEKL